MWFFRFAIILLEFLFIFYYTAVVFQLLDVWKITNRKITWKAIIPFYYFINQYPLTGNMEYWTTPGFHWQW